MLLRIDHIVHPVRDLEDASRRMAQAGLPFRPGGVHPAFRSRNALLYWDLTYWELLAFDAEPPETAPTFIREAYRSLQARGEVPTTFALSVAGLEETRNVLARSGIDTTPPAPGRRATPQGITLRWRTCEILTWPAKAGPTPFLIEHEGDDHERRDILAQIGFLDKGAAAGGPSRQGRLAELRWPVPDPEAASDRYRELVRVLGAARGPQAGPAVHLGSAILQPVPQDQELEVHLQDTGGAGSARAVGVTFRLG